MVLIGLPHKRDSLTQTIRQKKKKKKERDDDSLAQREQPIDVKLPQYFSDENYVCRVDILHFCHVSLTL